MTRPYGHGSLHLRQSDQRWIGRLPDGRGGYQYVTGTDHDDVRRRLDDLRRSRDRTTSRSLRGGERVGELLTRYLATIAPHRNRPRTLEGHAQIARDHIRPAIGTIRVAQLEPRDVQRMVDRMLARGLSPKTVSNAVNVLSAALRQAQREGIVTANVASLAAKPPIARRTLPSLTTDQVRDLLEATRGEPDWPIWVIAATMGLRIGEVLGLRWRDLGTEEGPPDGTGGVAQTRYTTLTVTGQYRYLGTIDGERRWAREAPKTEASAATLPLPALAREALDVARAQARSTLLVFSTRHGHPHDRTDVTKRWARTLARHGFPAVRLHSLRHSSVIAVLDNTGGDIYAAQNMARHANVSVTINVYGRQADEARKRAAEAMDRAMERRTS